MFDLLKARARHGYQAIKDIPGAVVNPRYRGFPVIDEARAGAELPSVIEQCPSRAILDSPLRVDMGRCVFCGQCARQTQALSFTNFNHTAATSRDALVIGGGMTPELYKKTAVESRTQIHSLFGRSLKLRSVSAGGCNGCEMELNAASNVNFDMGRYGIDMVASPRHADGLIITGPVTENMAGALEDTWKAIPSPKIVIALGTCAISGGLFEKSPAVNRRFFDSVKVDLYLPGCPAHPLTIVNGIIDYLGRRG
ncbi:MAG: hypothetical protein ACRCUT_12965, partial [Spirochaetota bacterium]